MNTLWKGLVVAALLQASSVSALTPVDERPPRPPQIWLDPTLALQPIQLQDVAIDIRIQGFIASTRLDLTFHNPNPRVLEGEFVFPLAEGQSITGYALEVEGKLRKGVVVEKETARVAYESTVRRGIDPGLAELTQGNVFRTRLYPLPAQGTKRVQITFDQPLIDTGNDYRYLLPLQFSDAVKHFTVRAEVLQTETKPASGGDGALSFEQRQGGFVANLERANFRPERELAFRVPKPATPVSVFTIADRLDPGWRRFAAQVQSAPARIEPAAAPRRIALYYDASGSAATRERARELDFLDAWLRALRNVEIDLIAFRNDVDAPERFTIRDGDARALRAAIEALPLDGASTYGALRIDAAAQPDLVLVIGDGLSNFGSGEPQFRTDALTPRLVFVHAAQTVDSARLTRWARRNTGQVINLLALDDTAALRQLEQTRWALQATRVLRGRCDELTPEAPQPAGAVFSLYGRCSGDAELQLEFGNGTGKTLLRTLTPGSGNALESGRGDFVERLWATARIADLENADTRDRNAIVELSKKYGVVTQDTSMLVLDRIEDYVRYEVEPHEPELAEAYRRQIARQPVVSEQGPRDLHRGQTMVQWQSFRNWHAGSPHAWLETLLPPAADAEVVRWEALPALKDSRAHLAEARAIDREARALQKRWTADRADPARRTNWEREATGVMLRLDVLRQLRLTQAPDSDSIARKPQKIAGDDSEDRLESRRSLGRMRMAASPAASPPGDIAVASEAVEEAAPATETAANAAPPAPSSSQPSVERFAGGTRSEEARIAKGADGANAVPPHASVDIELRDWDPNTPYLARLRAANDPYAAYLQERREQAATPAFFLDCANFFRTEARNDRLALRVLSNLAEIDFDSAPLLRVLAYRLQQWNRFDLAVPLFEQALKLRGEEPQSRRDLALALSRREQPDYTRAVTLLWEIVDRQWDARFPEIELIALHELGDVIARAPATQHPALAALAEKLGMHPSLLEPLPVDLRVVLGWDADNIDIDLWVVDPLGEIAIYRNPRTGSGGHLSRDFTVGYGPEVFTIRRPIPGTYVVKTHYYASHAQKLTGAVTVQLEFLTRFASGDSKREAVTRRLDGANGEIEIGRFTVGAE